MFSNISWFQYVIFICAAALTWYVAILYIYYRHDLLQILLTKKTFQSGDGKTGHNLNFQQEHPAGINLKNSSSSPDMGQFLQSFTDEIAAYLEEAGKNKVVKANLLISIGRIANKYPLLAKSEFQKSLDQFIKLQTETYCAMFLSEEDLNNVWRDT